MVGRIKIKADATAAYFCGTIKFFKMKKIFQTTLVAAMLLFSQNILAQAPIGCNGVQVQTTITGSITPQSQTLLNNLTDIAVTGTLIIDKDFLFQNSNGLLQTLYMEQGASIILVGTQADPRLLEMINVNVKACGTEPWTKIEVDNEYEKLILNHCKIEDADFAAVHSVNTGDYELTQTTFVNNRTHVKVENSNVFHPGVIAGCTFTNTNNVQTGIFTNKCIDILNVEGIDVGVPSTGALNKFDNADYGIYAKNTSVNIYNNKFGYYSNLSLVNGIYLNGTGNNINPTVSCNIGGGGSMYRNYFEHCKPIQAKNGVDLTVVDNELLASTTNTITAIKCGDITIADNVIDNYSGHGIYINKIASRTIAINDNFINVGQQGISVFGSGHNNPNMVTADLTISGNSTLAISSGISVMAVEAPFISTNGIIIDGTSSWNGIKLTTCDDAIVKYNTISVSPAVNAGTGIRLTESLNCTLSNNTISHFRNSVLLDENITGLIFKCNTLMNAYRGIYLKGGTNSGVLDINCLSTSGAVEASNNFFSNTVHIDVENISSFGTTINWKYFSVSPSGIGAINFTPNSNVCSSCLAQPRLANTELVNISVYPNPATDVLNVDYNGDEALSLIMYDMLGKEVISREAITESITLDVSTLTKGLYFCKLYNNNGLLENKSVVISK